MANWLLVSSPGNFEKNRALDFRMAAMKSRHRRKWERVAEGLVAARRNRSTSRHGPAGR